MVPTDTLSKAIQLAPHWLCWGLWKFQVQAGPYRAAGGAEAELGYCSALQKVIVPNLE